MNGNNSSNDDDDWLEETPTGSMHQGGSNDPIVEQEYQKLSSRYNDAGYREGITSGKLSTLQQGFDSGFNTSITPSRLLGALKGRSSALLHYLQSQSSTPETSGHIEALRGLIRDLGRVKRDDILEIDYERLEHEREEHGGEGILEVETRGREMEGLMSGIEGMGGAQGKGEALREGYLLKSLEDRLKALEKAVWDLLG